LVGSDSGGKIFVGRVGLGKVKKCRPTSMYTAFHHLLRTGHRLFSRKFPVNSIPVKSWSRQYIRRSTLFYITDSDDNYL